MRLYPFEREQLYRVSMMNERLAARDHLVALLTLAACSNAQWSSDAMAYRQPPGIVTPVVLSRPRYTYEPSELDASLVAASIEVEIDDARLARAADDDTHTSTDDAAFASGDLEVPKTLNDRLSTRLNTLVTGSGSVMGFAGSIEKLALTVEEGRSVVAVQVVWTVATPTSEHVWRKVAEGGLVLRDPPLDRAELEELSIGAVILSLERLLRVPGVVEEINQATSRNDGISPSVTL